MQTRPTVVTGCLMVGADSLVCPRSSNESGPSPHQSISHRRAGAGASPPGGRPTTAGCQGAGSRGSAWPRATPGGGERQGEDFGGAQGEWSAIEHTGSAVQCSRRGVGGRLRPQVDTAMTVLSSPPSPSVAVLPRPPGHVRHPYPYLISLRQTPRPLNSRLPQPPPPQKTITAPQLNCHPN